MTETVQKAFSRPELDRNRSPFRARAQSRRMSEMSSAEPLRRSAASPLRRPWESERPSRGAGGGGPGRPLRCSLDSSQWPGAAAAPGAEAFLRPEEAAAPPAAEPSRPREGPSPGQRRRPRRADESEEEVLEEIRRKDDKILELARELQQCKGICREMMSARRKAREALSDMAYQNKRLVEAYAEKKSALKRLEQKLGDRAPPGPSEEAEALRAELSSARETIAGLRAKLEGQDDAPLQAIRDRLKWAQQENEDLRIENFRLKKELEALKLEVPQVHDSPSSQAGASPDSASKPSLQKMATFKTLKIRRLQEENETIRKEREEIAQRAERMARAESHKREGTICFQRHEYSDALMHYTSAIEQHVEDPQYNAILYCNRASCHLALNHHLACIWDCCNAVSLDPSYPRVYHRRADAYQALGDYSNAYNDMVILVERLGAAHDVKDRLAHLQELANSSIPVNHYAVLGVTETATDKEIRAAYKRLALIYHPDKEASTVQRFGSEIVFKMLSDAHRMLTSSSMRQLVDQGLKRSSK
uniref:DnaJ homolog subfamily C member 7 n=1 Tax=Tetraselmis sp. GSL018 TaxID=582737 RepID=A0A061R9Q0_9CHLO|mmetsp:Transcript_12029/g.28515  ORF Transcript_12029/g.28515 Transcript_12029/m.28515 type:complete len:533 (+) Transcript_12029:278-1876(+)|eukprot:CAMPEP_0177591658 /NCGR_PEP_ID=MMETSP0419_2-20121207/8120_1 /TAXON_ID=582737 /ORGANISM="Tetraselmis sp., Strain GSL018" /LENGTH=532 /DNA_ID=CAMNT_0019082425 /DNA_START=241 /DNA_END=1839 /DNA_ORIENTATION=+